MKFFTFLFLVCSVFSFSYAQDVNLPLDFENGPYEITSFDGGELTVVSNSEKFGINTSDSVAQMIKGEGQTWGGAYISLSSAIDFSASYKISMKVFSPRVDVPVLLKLEAADDNQVFKEITVNTTIANDWETLTFDFTGGDTDTYSNVVIIFENGTAGDGSADWTFLIDDIEQVSDEEQPSTSTNINSNNIVTYTNNGMLFVNSAEEIVNGQVEVFDITGQKLLSSTLSSNSQHFNINAKGIVIVRIMDAENNLLQTKKLIVNE